MASLKDLRGRITSVRNTRKITSAMKMVSASKLRRAQSQAEAARPYAERMARMLTALAASARNLPTAPRLLAGTGQEQKQLLIVVTADRGLAGAFNSNVGRAARTLIRRLEGEGKQVRIITVGRKGRDFLRREFADRLVGEVSFAGRKSVSFADVDGIAEQATAMVQNGEADVVRVLYNRFVSVVSQIPTEAKLVPLPMPETMEEQTQAGARAIYEFEPDEETILGALLPRNLAIQLFRAVIESAAGEQGARMAAMDNATRNAGEMITRLTLNYNRTRQANITRELIEIISGAEAV